MTDLGRWAVGLAEQRRSTTMRLLLAFTLGSMEPVTPFPGPSRRMVDLNTLLPLNSGWVLMEANDINDNGQITGYGLHNGVGRAFRLSPYKMVNI